MQQKNRETSRSSMIHIAVKTGVTALIAIFSITVALGVSMQEAQAISISPDEPYQPGRFNAANTEKGAIVLPNPQSLSLEHDEDEPGKQKPGRPHPPRIIRPDPDDYLDYNTFPFGTCTWYANNRFHELYGYFVPWHNNAMAWQWTARAADYGWDVSPTPSVGAIAVLQSGVQGAGSAGHVAVVEQVLDDGSVIGSSMNWWPNPAAVSYQRYTPGPGVSFIKPS